MVEDFKKLPEFLRSYFWEVDFEALTPEKHARYIIAKILEYGDERALKWMFKQFNMNLIKDVLCKTRAVSPYSAFFWANVLEVDKKKVKCLNRSYLLMRKKSWRY